MRPRIPNSPRRGGFTLVEVVVAGVILLGLTVGIMSTLTYASTAARINTNATVAKNIAQGYFELMAADEFANVDPANYPDIAYDSVPPVYLDTSMDVRCRVEFEFDGYGTVSSASSTNLTDDTASWEIDEWAGDAVFIVSGAGAGQMSHIVSNTAQTLELREGLTFSNIGGSRYMINNGKTVLITTTWQYQGREYSSTVESLVANRDNSENLGF